MRYYWKPRLKKKRKYEQDTKHSLHQQQFKNSQAFNINLVRINMEGRTALSIQRSWQKRKFRNG